MCLKHLGVFERIRIEFSVTTFALKYFRCLGSVLAIRSNITRCCAFAFWVSRRKKFLLELSPSFSNDVILFDWSSIRHNVLTNIEDLDNFLQVKPFISSGLVCYGHLVPSDHVLNYALNPFTLHTSHFSLHTFIFHFLSYLPDISLTRR